MADYQQMYLTLFRKVTKAIALLQEAQIEAEEFFTSSDNENVRILPSIFDSVSHDSDKEM